MIYTIQIDLQALPFELIEYADGLRQALEFEINSLYMDGIDGLDCEPRPIMGVAMSSDIVGKAFLQEDDNDYTL